MDPIYILLGIGFLWLAAAGTYLIASGIYQIIHQDKE